MIQRVRVTPERTVGMSFIDMFCQCNEFRQFATKYLQAPPYYNSYQKYGWLSTTIDDMPEITRLALRLKFGCDSIYVDVQGCRVGKYFKVDLCQFGLSKLLYEIHVFWGFELTETAYLMHTKDSPRDWGLPSTCVVDLLAIYVEKYMQHVIEPAVKFDKFIKSDSPQKQTSFSSHCSEGGKRKRRTFSVEQFNAVVIRSEMRKCTCNEVQSLLKFIKEEF